MTYFAWFIRKSRAQACFNRQQRSGREPNMRRRFGCLWIVTVTL